MKERTTGEQARGSGVCARLKYYERDKTGRWDRVDFLSYNMSLSEDKEFEVRLNGAKESAMEDTGQGKGSEAQDGW